MDAKELAFRKRLATDFAFWAENFCTIRTKDQELKKFKLNKVQRDLLKVIEGQLATTGKIRIVVLKARQQGLSTFVSAYNYWRLSNRPARKGMVVAQHTKTTSAMFDMYRRIHDDLPDQLRPSTRYRSKNELTFAKLDTGIMVATAGGDAMGRGETITDAHLSEVAFWPDAHAENNLNAVNQSISPRKDTTIFVESTANGISGPYYDLWINAVKGKNGFVPFFAPWYDSEDHRDSDDLPDNLADILDEEEKLLQKKYGLDLEQLWFRRKKIAGPGGYDKFKQEYPSTAEEAFLSSGSPIFDPTLIVKRLHEVQPPKKNMTLMGLDWVENDWGELSIYRERVDGSEYWIGADVALGKADGDYSVAQILDEDQRQVAVWRGKVNPVKFAEILFRLGHLYNEALIAVERNMHGYGVLADLQRKFYYPNIYTNINEGQVQEIETSNLGFYTNKESKAKALAKLSEDIRTGMIEINDETTLLELQTFVEIKEGVYGADVGKHDDCVMSLAIANQVFDGRWTPIAFGDEFYR